MRTLHKCLSSAAIVLVLGAATAAGAHAGVFIGWSGYDDQLQPGAVIPGNGEPFSHRYNFYAGPSFYLGPNSDYNHFAYMDYLDRLDRAEKFGYRIPDPPAFLSAPPCRPCGR